MRISRLVLGGCFIAPLLLAPLAEADPIDPGAARELLKQGYALKKEGKFADALARLLESLRLDSQLKTLINIADCEENLGQLTNAQKHWILARDQASLQGDQTLLGEAERRLASLETRLPRLTINRANPPVENTEVRRDGVLLGAVSLGLALPTDPGHHQVVVSAIGHEDRRYEVDLAERDSKVIEVAPGPEKAATREPSISAPLSRPAAKEPASQPQTTSVVGSRRTRLESDRSLPTRSAFWNAQRGAAVAAAGLGIVGFAVAGASWSSANTSHEDALRACTPVCGDTAKSKQADAIDAVHLSNTMLVAGSILVAGGTVLWLTSPSPRSEVSVSLAAAPTTQGGGFVALGTF
jgi:hypothetical protein